MNYLPLLGTALQSDYFLILNMLHGDDELSFLIPKSMHSIFIKSAEILDFELECLESSEPLCFIMRFKSKEDKETLENDMILFNQQLRKPSIIPMPDIYLGNSEIDRDLCSNYLSEIAGFFADDFKGNVFIPIGLTKAGLKSYAVFSEEGLVGEFDESQIE